MVLSKKNEWYHCFITGIGHDSRSTTEYEETGQTRRNCSHLKSLSSPDIPQLNQHLFQKRHQRPIKMQSFEELIHLQAEGEIKTMPQNPGFFQDQTRHQVLLQFSFQERLHSMSSLKLGDNT